MTKYVDDLREVRPSEIEHVDGRKIISIHEIPDLPEDANSKIAIIFNDYVGLYTVDGRFMKNYIQEFKYKPKTVKYLKPLHMILAENPNYFINKWDEIENVGEYMLQADMLSYLGKPLVEEITYEFSICDTWIEERTTD